jgi:hypothetical protein
LSIFSIKKEPTRKETRDSTGDPYPEVKRIDAAVVKIKKLPFLPEEAPESLSKQLVPSVEIRTSLLSVSNWISGVAEYLRTLIFGTDPVLKAWR